MKMILSMKTFFYLWSIDSLNFPLSSWQRWNQCVSYIDLIGTLTISFIMVFYSLLGILGILFVRWLFISYPFILHAEPSPFWWFERSATLGKRQRSRSLRHMLSGWSLTQLSDSAIYYQGRFFLVYDKSYADIASTITEKNRLLVMVTCEDTEQGSTLTVNCRPVEIPQNGLGPVKKRPQLVLQGQ